jgi:hypothetical protein
MKKVLILFFAVTLALGFAYVIDADAQCNMMGGGSGGVMKGGCGMGGCGMSGMGAMKGACGNPGCMCGPGCSGPGCMCGAMSGMGAMKGACGTPGCVCGAGCPGAGCACGSMAGMGRTGGPGMGNPMMKVFLEETKNLRKELHIKKFEYAEAARNFDVPVEELMQMEKEIKIIQMKINRYWLK